MVILHFNSDGTGNRLILDGTHKYEIQWEVLDGAIYTAASKSIYRLIINKISSVPCFYPQDFVPLCPETLQEMIMKITELE